MQQDELRDFIAERRGLAWYVKDPRSLPEESIVEAVLNYGNWQDLQRLVGILGMEKVARIFRRHSKPSKMGRQNYFPDVVRYFTLYFDKYAPYAIDFDLFSREELQHTSIRQVFSRAGKKIEVLRSRAEEFTFLVDSVQMTFFQYPYPVEYSETFENIAKLPTLLTLAAMKAFALGQRNKWKDYVDMYFVMRDFHSLHDIIQKAEELFGTEFNEKLFRQQLAYSDDIDYREEVAFMPGFEVSKEQVKKGLTEFSLT